MTGSSHPAGSTGRSKAQACAPGWSNCWCRLSDQATSSSWDNLGSHKSAAIRQMIQAAGARLWYLPPYSPHINPIEQAFAKIKHWMRLAQKRTIEETWRHLGHLVSSIQPAQCTNYFQNAGYPSEKS